ncbi:MAG: FtsX-like permease family protein [Gordonia sp. (in: high G+C Gram-positive bacteria)]
MRATSSRLTIGKMREVATIGVVAGLASCYATTLFGVSDVLDKQSQANGGAAGVVLDVVSSVFIGIALFVSAIVIANGVDTVVAGRTRQLTLLRLIGASGKQLRASMIRAVARVAAVGAGVGLLVGVAIVGVLRAILRGRDLIPDVHYTALPGGAVASALAVIATAIVATAVGTRRSLGAQALHGARPVDSRLRAVFAALLSAAGVVALVGACLLGEHGDSPAGFLAAFVGAVLLGVGVLIGAPMFLPRLVALAGRLGGPGSAALVARKNAVSDPRRTTRSTIGLLIGVTLITTIAAGMHVLTASVDSWTGLTPHQVEETRQMLQTTSAILIALIAISAVIAGVGFVSTMSLTVIARTREIGILRAMGFTGRQIRQMITLEALALSGTAATVGLILGVVLGAVGSQSIIGSVTSGFVIGLPWPALTAIVAATAVVVLVASLPPSRRAVAVHPTAALATA